MRQRALVCVLALVPAVAHAGTTLWSPNQGDLTFKGLTTTTIDNMVIGQSTPAAATVTTLNATASGSRSSDYSQGGNTNCTGTAQYDGTAVVSTSADKTTGFFSSGTGSNAVSWYNRGGNTQLVLNNSVTLLGCGISNRWNTNREDANLLSSGGSLGGFGAQGIDLGGNLVSFADMDGVMGSATAGATYGGFKWTGRINGALTTWATIGYDTHDMTNGTFAVSIPLYVGANKQLADAHGNFYDQNYVFIAPSAADTVVMADTTDIELMKPAGTLATLTVQLPTCSSTYNGKIASFSSSQAVTALTVTATAGSVSTAPSSLAAGAGARYSCRGNDTTWYQTP